MPVLVYRALIVNSTVGSTLTHRILDIAIACGGTVIVDAKGATVAFTGRDGTPRECGVSLSEGLTLDAALRNLELALGRRGVDLVRGGHDGG